MKWDAEKLNKFIQSVTTGDTVVTITKMEYYPTLEYQDGEFVQSETYRVKIDSEYFPRYIENKIYEWLKITLIWEVSLV
jgi:hypothetical protein